MNSNQKDHSSFNVKLKLREHFLEKLNEPKVLDLFCGTGGMYKHLYKNYEYKGIDIDKIHDEDKCLKMDNKQFISENDVSGYNYFDLDAYGCPYELMYLLAEKELPNEFTLIVTDGSPLNLKRNSKLKNFKIISSIERIPKERKIPHLYYFYEDIFLNFISKFCEKSNTEPTEILRSNNKGINVYYWGIHFKRKRRGLSGT